MPDLNFGGVETVLEIFSNQEPEPAWNHVFVATRSGGRAAKTIRANGHRVFSLKMKSRIPSIGLLLRLIALFKKLKPDLVHCRCVEANFHGVLAARFAGKIPVLVEEVGLTRDRRSFLATFVLAKLYQFSACLLCPSKAIRQDLRIAGARHPWMPVVYNPVDPVFFLSRIRQPRHFRFTAVSRLVPEKNLDLLLKAFASCSFPLSVNLEIFGEGPLRKELEALAQQLGISRQIRWQGFRPRSPANLAAASVYVLTSEREGHPVALLEAMAAGLPVIATSVGGVKEILTASSGAGELIPNKDESSLKRAMEKLYRSNKAELLRMGNRGRDLVVKKFSPQQYTKTLYHLYEKIIKNSSRHPFHQVCPPYRSSI